MLLTIAREIRDKIYEYCSPPQALVKTTFSNGRPAELGSVNLLCVCKRVHDEAAIIYYGNKTFVFSLGWHSGNLQDEAIFFDNTTWLPAKYLRLIKTCIINIETPDLNSDSFEKNFMAIKQQLQSFADGFGDHHSLKELQISNGTEAAERMLYWAFEQVARLSRPAQDEDFKSFIDPLSAAQNLLEPLGGIYGVSSVTVKGVGQDLATRLAGAVTCDQKAVGPAPETYKTRLVKVKGHGRKKQAQQYRVSKYNDPKVVWNLDLMGPVVWTTDEDGRGVATRKVDHEGQHRVLDTAEDTDSPLLARDQVPAKDSE